MCKWRDGFQQAERQKESCKTTFTTRKRRNAEESHKRFACEAKGFVQTKFK
jgi:uncharacterized protein YeaC (DUF1315 family)